MKNRNLKVQQQQVQQPDGNQILQGKAELFMGPFPHPEIMEGYARVDPELPRVIMESFKEEGKHRRSLERRTQWIGVLTFLISNILAFSSVIAICYVGYLYLINGAPKEGSYIIISVTAGVVALFLGRKYFESKASKRE